MTAATADGRVVAPPIRATGSLSRGRRRTLYWSYFFLVLFVVFFLTPPLYMLLTSLKSSGEISEATTPWWFHMRWVRFSISPGSLLVYALLAAALWAVWGRWEKHVVPDCW